MCGIILRPTVTSAAIEVVERFYALQRRFYAGEDVGAAMRELLAADVEWHVPGRSPIAGDHHGHDEVLAYFARRRDRAERTFRVTPVATLTEGERVVQLADGEALIAGKTRRWRTAGIYRVVDGRIAECRLVPFDLYEFDAIWSAGA